MTAGEIGAQFELTAATVSHHLAVLRKAGLVRVEREGKYLYYELNTSVVEDALLWLSSLRGGPHGES